MVFLMDHLDFGNQLQHLDHTVGLDYYKPIDLRESTAHLDCLKSLKYTVPSSFDDSELWRALPI